MILVRERRDSAGGVLFITVEDETGVANSILWPDRFAKLRHTVFAGMPTTDARLAPGRGGKGPNRIDP